MNIATDRFIQQAHQKVTIFQEFKKAGFICQQGGFFPSVHYPPITMYPSTDEEKLFKDYRIPSDGLFVIYAHIPFCINYCTFCHYPVKIHSSVQERDEYLAALEKEMDLYLRRLDMKKLKARSVLIGGGTATYLTPAQLRRFLESFTARVSLQSCAQFSYDVDPSTLLGAQGNERLRIMKSYGVDRLTIGIQSLEDRILQSMNRAHTAGEAIQAIEAAQKAGFKINIEFIYGFPGQTMEDWIHTVTQSVQLGVEEIQLYRLKIIPYGDHQGFITKKFAVQPHAFLADEQEILMKETAIVILRENGYTENLRRVFSREKNDYSRYADDQCCKLFDQIGFGLTAFSSLRDRFGLNTQFFEKYYALIKQGQMPLDRGMVRDKDAQLRWAIILPLKNRSVYKKFYQQCTGVSLDTIFRKKIERLKEYGLLQEDAGVLQTTELGSFFSDEVCQQFHHPQYMPFPQAAYAPGPLNPYNDPQP